MAWDLNRSIPVLLDDSTYEFIYQPGSYVPFAQIEKSTTGEVTYLHSDSIGSVMAATDDTGALIDHYSYDPYGISNNQRATPFGFAGQYQDEVTGLYDFRNRVYDPLTGSFLQRDPIEVMTDEPYAYTSGNPLQYVDPLGLCSLGRDLINIGSDCYRWMDSNAFINTSDTVAGFGDGMTMGGTAQIRNLMGAQGVVCETSAAYAWGGYTSIAASFVVPGGGIRLAQKVPVNKKPSEIGTAFINVVNDIRRPGTLYRGVPSHHPAYGAAVRGTVSPPGTNMNINKHIRGGPRPEESGYTAWTTDKKIAEAAAMGASGVVLRIKPRRITGIKVHDVRRYDVGKRYEHEREFAIEGVIRHADVRNGGRNGNF